MMGVFAPPSPLCKNVSCVRETEILVEQQPPQGVFVCDHAGLVMNKFSLQDDEERAAAAAVRLLHRSTLHRAPTVILHNKF